MTSTRSVIIEGPAMRQSIVASGFCNERHFVLEKGPGDEACTLSSFRSPDEDSASKTFPISGRTTLSPLADSAFKLRSKGAESLSGLLTAIVKTKAFKHVHLHYFTLTFAQTSSLLGSSDDLSLCFPDVETAAKWHSAFAGAIADCAAAAAKAPSAKRRKELAAQSSDVEDATAVLAASSSDRGLGGSAAASPAAAGGDAGASHSTEDAQAPSPPRRRWYSVHHVNGVAVYAEEEGENGDGGAFMASVVVRAPPAACFRALMSSNSSRGGAAGEIPFTDGIRVLETIDAHSHVVRHVWAPNPGLERRLIAPRDLVALRSWRCEPDGTYIVLFQSTTHRAARPAPGRWFSALGGSAAPPVRATLQAAGFTISPLMPQYVPGGGASQECLVTLVVKADMEGGLSQRGMLSRWIPAVADAGRWALLDPLLMSVVALRDRVEQRRFVVFPSALADGNGGISRGTSWVLSENEWPSSTAGRAAEKESGRGVDGPASPSLTVRQAAAVGAAGGGASGGRSPSFDAAQMSPSFASGRPLSPVQENIKETFSDAEEPAGAMAAAVAACSEAPAHGGAAAAVAAAAATARREVVAAAAAAESIWGARGTTPSQFWSQVSASGLQIRGASYLQDRVKIPAQPPMFDLFASDLVDGDEPLWHIGRSLASVALCPAPFAFVMNLIYPANGMLQSLVTVWTAPVDVSALDEEALIAHWGDDGEGTVRSFFSNLKPWMEGDGAEADNRRNQKFKLIPRVAQGSWVVRQSVGTTPVLLGKKLKTKYFRGRTEGGTAYFEVDVDITSNTVANSVTRLVVNSITSLVVDLAPLVEGQAPDELPERLLGTVRYDHLNLRTSSVWDEGSGRAVPRPEI